MKPSKLKTKIFLDGGDPTETRQAIEFMGFLDGQTTNPTLIAKSPQAVKRLESGKKFTKDEVYNFYESVVKQVSSQIPKGSVSIEVYADEKTTAGEMLDEASKMFSWILNAHIKFPTTSEGLKAAEEAVKRGIRVNMTLVFSQQQAAAVYAATRGAQKGQVFVSPFIGRLDDQGQNGMMLVENIVKMYRTGDGHVEVLAASIRNLYHLMYSIKLGSDILTLPLKTIKEWKDASLTLPDENFVYNSDGLHDIPYLELDLSSPWQEFDISHPLTETGLQRFSNDWNALLEH